MRGATGYEIQRYASNAKKWVTVKVVTSGTTLSFKDTGLRSGVTYQYRVRAVKTVSGTSYYSDFGTVKKAAVK